MQNGAEVYRYNSSSTTSNVFTFILESSNTSRGPSGGVGAVALAPGKVSAGVRVEVCRASFVFPL